MTFDVSSNLLIVMISTSEYELCNDPIVYYGQSTLVIGCLHNRPSPFIKLMT